MKLLDNLKVSHRCLKYFDFHFISTFCLARSRYSMLFSMIWISIGFYFFRRKHRDTMRSFCNSIAFTKTFLSTTNIFLFLIPSFVVSKFAVFNSRNINFYFYENFLNFFCIKSDFIFLKIHIFCSKISALAQFYLS